MGGDLDGQLGARWAAERVEPVDMGRGHRARRAPGHRHRPQRVGRQRLAADSDHVARPDTELAGTQPPGAPLPAQGPRRDFLHHATIVPADAQRLAARERDLPGRGISTVRVLFLAVDPLGLVAADAATVVLGTEPCPAFLAAGWAGDCGPRPARPLGQACGRTDPDRTDPDRLTGPG